MTTTATPTWESKRTDETREIEDILLAAGFAQANAYRQNSATIRVRVIDPRFEGLAPESRDALVEPYFDRLKERTQADITTLFTFAPSELQDGHKTPRECLLNLEFDEPSRSML